tara:strand:+ start:2428 stop:2661 length:234 start_codon:yes stop_codon:yes gene_type:complete
MKSERYKYLLDLQRVLVICGIGLAILIYIVVNREGFFSTFSLIMYGIGILYLTIATHISISDVLTRDRHMRDKEEDL